MRQRVLWKLGLIFAFLVLPMSLQMLLQASPVAAQAVKAAQQDSAMSAQAVNSSQWISSVSKPAAGNQKSCKMGLYLISLHDFNMANKTFTADMWLWSVCPDKTYEPLQGKAIEFVNANAVTLGDLISEQRGAQYWQTRRVAGVFRQNWDVHNYPFDGDTLQIVIEDADKDITQFVYMLDTTNSTYNRDMGLSGWSIKDFRLTASAHQYSSTFGDPTLKTGEGSTYTQMRANITIERAEQASFWKLIAPAGAAFLIALASLFLTRRDEIGSRITLLAGALFTVVISMRVADDALGSSAGVTLVDTLHVVTLISVLVAVGVAVGWQLVLDRRALASGRDVQLLLPRAGSMQPSLLGAESKSSGDVSTANSLAIPQIPLFLVADVHAFLEEDGQTAFVGKSYPVHAGIAARKSGKEQASLLLHNMTEPLLFEASLHASPNIKLTTEWNKSLTYSPRHAESDVVEFRFEATAPEPSFLVIDFYQERHWFRTARIEFNAVGQSQLPTVTNKE